MGEEDGFLNNYFNVTEINFEEYSSQLVYYKNIKGLVETALKERKLSKDSKSCRWIFKRMFMKYRKRCLNVKSKKKGFAIKKEWIMKNTKMET